MAKNILVTGASGQLGQTLQKIAKEYPNYKFIFTDRVELDITNPLTIKAIIESKRPDWIINTAAYTAVDNAENEQELAELINNKGVALLVAESRKRNIGLVHISTDYVFGGNSQEILTEEMETLPLTVYGQTKLAGEIEALQYSRSIVLRTGWLYSPYGKNFLKTILQLASAQGEINVVADQWGTPTSAEDLARAVMTAITMADRQGEVYGLYHFANEGATCWADFAEQILMLSGSSSRIKHITSEEYPGIAKRPLFTILSSKKFKNSFGVEIAEWETSLETVLEQINSEPQK